MFPRIEPDPKALEFYRTGRQNSGFTWQELAEISLWASGDTSAANLRRIITAAETIINSPELPVSARERAEFILTFMHRNILRSYSLYQTRVDTVFSNGRFNCVSSAVLYIIFCKSIGIETSGVMTKDHAFVTVHINGEDIDVETTNRHGFDPGNRKEFHDQIGRVTGFAYVPAQNYHDRQTISQIELVSLILSNRIADNERQNRFAEAVPIAIDRAALLKGNALTVNTIVETPVSIFIDPRSDLMDRLFNFGAMLLRAGREEDALRWAAIASPVFPDSERWDEFILAAANNNLMKHTRAGRLEQARTFLEEQRNVLTQNSFEQLESLLIDAELLRKANNSRTAADGNVVIAEIVRARDSGKMEERRASELITFTVSKTATALCAAPGRDWRSAIAYLEDALSRFGANREWEQAARTYRGNLAADYHNRFATAWNRGNHEEAERILNEGLAEFPDNRQLLSNRDIVERHKARN